MAYLRTSTEFGNHIDLFRSLRGKIGHVELGVFIAEGPKIVPIVLKSDLRIRAALMTEHWLAQFESLLLQRTEDVELAILPKAAMEEIVGYPLHQGVMLAVEIPVSPNITDILELAPHPQTIVALDSIADAENMGTIIRNCAAFGVTALLVDGQSCHPFLRRSVRVSMGTIVELPIIRVADLADALLKSLSCGHQVIATTLSERSLPLDAVELPPDVTLVFGAEGTGVTNRVLERCNFEVQISMISGIDSLNVGVANGIVLFHRMSLLAQKQLKLHSPSR
jgi:tRNA G18 (ribose-2'-O)-methylase SpoU